MWKRFVQLWKRLDRWTRDAAFYKSNPPMLRREFITNALFVMLLRKGLFAAAMYLSERYFPDWLDPSHDEQWRSLVAILPIGLLGCFFIFGLSGLLKNRLRVFTDFYPPQALITLATLAYIWFFPFEIAYDPLHALLQAAVLAVFALLPERAIPDASQKTDSRGIQGL